MQQHQRAGQNALSGPFQFLASTPLRTNLTKSSPSLRVELVIVGFVPRAGRVLKYGYKLVGWCRWGESGTPPGLLRKVPMSETVQTRTPGGLLDHKVATGGQPGGAMLPRGHRAGR